MFSRFITSVSRVMILGIVLGVSLCSAPFSVHAMDHDPHTESMRVFTSVSCAEEHGGFCAQDSECLAHCLRGMERSNERGIIEAVGCPVVSDEMRATFSPCVRVKRVWDQFHEYRARNVFALRE